MCNAAHRISMHLPARARCTVTMQAHIQGKGTGTCSSGRVKCGCQQQLATAALHSSPAAHSCLINTQRSLLSTAEATDVLPTGLCSQRKVRSIAQHLCSTLLASSSPAATATHAQ
eukprot:GHRQ01020509.1.p3 GENE.GHRQ01020509.1~~GHRQ01020509.1.p3  ORF type:complete len:115 (-),score=22.11 GHRQ01020509.1:941-1285(-)